MEYAVKTTRDLTARDKESYLSLFNEVFSRNITWDSFEKKYKSPVSGFSYHGLMVEDEMIAGAVTVIPVRYHFFKQQYTFGLCVDAMVKKEFRSRNIYGLKYMYQALVPSLKEAGLPFVFGFPNQVSLKYWLTLVGWESAGRYAYYMLPVRIGAVKPSLRWLNWLSRFCSFWLNKIPRHRRKGGDTPIRKVVDDAFLSYRYQYPHYHKITLENQSYFIYRLVDENGVKTVYILDIIPYSARNLSRAVKAIHALKGKQIDAILYVGYFTGRIVNLFRVPRKLEPIPVYLCGDILDEKAVDRRIFDPRNWGANLGDFDVK